MADLSLDLSPGSSTYGDLLIAGGDLVLTSDVNTAGTHPVLQDILARLRTWHGEWFLDNTIGLAYFETILVKSPDLTAISTAIKDAILSTPGVLTLDSFSTKVAAAERTLTVTFSVSSVSGQVTYSGVLANTSQDQQGAT